MKNLQQMRRARGLSQAKLAALIGVHQTAISQWEKGRTSPDRRSLSRLSEVLGVSIDALLGNDVTTGACLVPILGDVRAGVPVEAVQTVLGYEEITPQMARGGEHFALRVQGESMLPRFCPGDVVIVRRQEDADTGDIVVALVGDGDATVKRLIKKENGVVLMPLNAVFDPLVFSVQEVAQLPVRIIGKVVELRAKFA